ncbi:MAG: helicase [Ignavibacteria bacterium]|nr:helicase [Ignavibacteria bacterium]
MENLDLSFITNQPNQKLKDRFIQLIRDARKFDCLVGYFYLSGFYLIQDALENVDKIRILVGLGISEDVYRAFSEKDEAEDDLGFLSSKKIIEKYLKNVKEEFENSEDKPDVELGILKFIEMINSNKLQIRIYPERKLHAKVYILTFKEGDRDVGRVITGSSNLTYAGLVDNLEFNVELKNPSDYKFALEKFEELWKDGIDITTTIPKFINEETWLKGDITPYELYLKFLYEYFVDDLNAEQYLSEKYLPEGFIEFDYQTQAILNAKKIIEAYGGCFISDVVGLGKTYVAARLIRELGGRTMVIAPPKLLDRNTPGSWINVFYDFNLSLTPISIGKLDDALDEINRRNYDNIIIDEAHRFRNTETISYTKLAQICRGKRVILVTATPYNNKPEDLLSQISLFQNKRASTIPGIKNLEGFFKGLEKRFNGVDRNNDYEKYLKIVKENSKEIREKCLKYIMVRRTRSEIEKYFAHDLAKNNIKFPEVKPPRPLFYQLNDEEDNIFMETVRLITKRFTYARYKPLLYFKDEFKIDQLTRQSQENLGGFMKVLLVKRLESSFDAFRKTLDRFIESHRHFIYAYENGKVYLSDRYMSKIFEYLENDNDLEIQKLIDEGKAEEYSADEFKEELIHNLKNDYELLKYIRSQWKRITRDPKVDKLIEQLKNDPILQNKVIIFTESKETAEYIGKQIKNRTSRKPLVYHGGSTEKERKEVTANFDARAKEKKDDYDILISTEVLSEGVNLHRSNVVLNYDIPWNPTRLMQRVGRINRVDTKFDKIYTYNFFPSKQADKEIDLTNIARAKIEAFLNLLGGDSAILTENEPVSSHELFDKLISVKSLIEDDESEESELKYLRIIEDIRDNNPDLFSRIKKLPKKARSSKKQPELMQNLISQTYGKDSVITFFRKGKLVKFYLSDDNSTYELDFLTAAKIFETDENTLSEKFSLEKFYEFLTNNKTAFNNVLIEDEEFKDSRGGRDPSKELMANLKALEKLSQQFTDEQENYIENLMERIKAGALPKQIIRNANKGIKKMTINGFNPLEVFYAIKRSIPDEFLKEHLSELKLQSNQKREIILSLYLKAD